MFKLPLPKGQTITQIIHLADIHIRQGDMKKSRYDEYEKVINRLVDQLVRLPSVQNGTAVTAIMGDILDHKVLMTATGCALFYLLINSLSQLAPVYILQGNHDFQQGLPDEPGLLDSLLLNKPANVCYLNKTGHYIAGDVGIGVACVRDIHKMGYGTGYVEQLPLFPPAEEFPDQVKIKLAFLHATISGCKLQNYTSEQRGLPIDWMKGYDACLLGDIHLSQVHNASQRIPGVHEWLINDINQSKPVWAYPGSLVQQNMGENPYDFHGYLIWDIPKKIIYTCNVLNEYGMINVRHNHKERAWETQVRKEWLSLRNNIDHFKSLKIRIHGSFESSHLVELQNILREREIKYEVVRGLVNRRITSVDQEETVSERGSDNSEPYVSETYNNPSAWIEYLQGNSRLDKTKLDRYNWQDWLKNPLTLQISEADVDPSLYETIRHRNKIIRGYLAELEDSLKTSPPKVRINFRHLTWQWLFCYGENSWLNFERMESNVCIVNAPNSHGKSALFDIICLAIFGQATPLRGSSENLLCKYKPEGTGAKTQLLLDIDDQKYCLLRTFNRKKNNSIQSNCIIYKEKDGSYYEYLGDSSSNKWIKNNVGELADFILSAMVTQTTQEDFFNLTNKKQIEYLDLALNQIPYTNLLNLFNEVKNALTQIETKQEAVIAAFTKNITKIDTVVEDKARMAHVECVAKITELEGMLKDVQKKIKREAKYISDVNDVVLAAFIKAHEAKLLPEERRDKDPISNLTLTKVAFEKVRNYYVKTFVPNSGDKRTTMEPQIKESDIQLEEELLKDWRTKYSMFKYDEGNKEKLKRLLKLIEDYEDELSRIKRPELRGTYEEYESKYLQALETLEKLDETCRIHPLIVPDISQEVNDDRSVNLEREIRNLGGDCDWENLSFDSHFITLKTALDETNITVNKIRFRIKELIDIKEPEKLVVIDKPYISNEDVEEWLKNHGEMKELVEEKQKEYGIRIKKLQEIDANRDRYSQLVFEIQGLEERIVKIGEENIPHNPECWACKLQPWKMHLEKEEEELLGKKNLIEELNNSYIKLGDYDNEVFRKETKEVEDWLNKFKQDMIEEDKYINLLYQWIEYNEFEQAYREYEEKRINYLRSRDTIIRLQNNLTEVLDELARLEKEINVMKTCKDNRERWLETRCAIEKSKIEWAKYLEAKTYHDQLVINRKIIDEKEDWENHNKWLYLKNELTMSREALKECLEHERTKEVYDKESVIWTAREEILKKNKQLYSRWKEDMEYNLNVEAYYLHTKLIELENQVEWLNWSEIKENRLALSDEDNIIKELESLRREKDKLLITETIHASAGKSYQSQCEQLLKYDDQLKAIRDKHKAIMHLMDLFTEFKYWVYSTKIIPSVLMHTNAIASLIANEKVALNARVRNDMNIDWLISNDGIDTIFSYGGGFDKFLFGLSIRLAIARVGACRVISKQLFIDEGFVAADRVHLERVPSLLDNLLDIYPTILLVTHIQSLKNEQYENIAITRNSKLSTIQFGEKESIKIMKSYESYGSEEVSDMKVSKVREIVKGDAVLDPTKCHGRTAKGAQCTNKKKEGDYCGKHSKKIIET